MKFKLAKKSICYDKPVIKCLSSLLSNKMMSGNKKTIRKIVFSTTVSLQIFSSDTSFHKDLLFNTVIHKPNKHYLHKTFVY